MVHTPYIYSHSGVNSHGNHFCVFYDLAGREGYHYCNDRGGFYQKNTDGSQYFNDRAGYSWFKTVEGQQTDYVSDVSPHASCAGRDHDHIASTPCCDHIVGYIGEGEPTP